MNRNTLLSVVLILAISTLAFGAGSRQDQIARVIRVYDGDTLMAISNGKRIKVRLVGIDAPETPKHGKAGQPYSNKSRKFLKSLVDQNKVTLIPFGNDRYDRTLAEVFVNGESVNLKMLDRGLAEAYRGKLPNGLKRERFLRAEKFAKKAKRGIWSLGSEYIPPWN